MSKMPRRWSGPRLLLWLLTVVLLLPVALGAALWFLGPSLVSPVEDFEQGPGAAVAYVGVSKQLLAQMPQLLTGKEIRVVLNETEFSGMLSSALLSGRGEQNPVQKVRADLMADQLRVESVILVDDPRVPARFRVPVGLRLLLLPSVEADGQVRFQITRATLGRIPISVGLIQWAGRTLSLDAPGVDARQAAVVLPVGDLISSQAGRKVTIKQFTVQDSQLTISLSMAR